MNVVAFVGAKGGTGKTTVASNVAAALALMGKRTLLIDADNNAPLTLALLAGVPDAGLSQALMGGEIPLVEVRENLALLPGEPQGVAVPSGAPFERLVEALRQKGLWDWVVFDTPGGMEQIIIGVMRASNIIVPVVDISPMGLPAHLRTFAFIQKVARERSVQVPGIVLSRVERKGAIERALLETVARYPLLPFVPESRLLKGQMAFSDTFPVETNYKYRSVKNLREIARALVSLSKGEPLPMDRYKAEVLNYLGDERGA